MAGIFDDLRNKGSGLLGDLNNFLFTDNRTQEQKEASEFFNRYKKTEDESKARHDRFKTDTKILFNSDFKGFEYNIGEKIFRYGVQNPDQVADKQSDISNFVGKFLDKDGNVTDTVNYH